MFLIAFQKTKFLYLNSVRNFLNIKILYQGIPVIPLNGSNGRKKI
jgi:hypothetical protein